MYKSLRDVFVAKRSPYSEEYQKLQLKKLNEIISIAENHHNFCTVHEVIDVNKHKIFKKPHLVEQVLANCKGQLKPFVFLNNKN
ncbi:MAG: hypothetical protein ACOVQE_07865 [Chitinophagaceae bacterium]